MDLHKAAKELCLLKKNRPQKTPKGFTLLEVQVSLSLLLFSLVGMSSLLMNRSAQTRWLGNQKTHWVIAPADRKKVITSHAIFRGDMEPPKYQLTITEFSEEGETLKLILQQKKRKK